MINNNTLRQENGLSNFVEETARHFDIPGVSVGVWTSGQEVYACHGTTSIINPLPVDRDTLFILGSVTKTYTATTLMRLVAKGKIDLNFPIGTYLSELKLSGTKAEERITVLNLLNHTSGLDWGLISDFGEGDDALALYVEKMCELKLIASPGTRTSYSQAGYNLAGRIIEKVTGQTFEKAVTSLIFKPLGLSHSFFNRDDIMTQRFCVGHNRDDEGKLSIATLWRRSRGDNPGGGIVSCVADQLRWARFHLGDGSQESGTQVLSEKVLSQMHKPTAELRGSNLGSAIGIGWFLRDVAGVRTIGHSGSANGQYAELLLVPDRNFAVVSLSNAGPDGIPFNQSVVRWALDNYLGLIDRDPEPIPFDALRAKEIIGNYQNDVMTLTIEKTRDGLRLEVLIKHAIRIASDKELPPDHAPFEFGLLSGSKDEYIITNGAFKGQRGFFTRDEVGVITGVDLAGRLFSRISTSL
ncbi:MAG: serine hydrolase domain-containing protein [Ginsengibacter sp.]